MLKRNLCFAAILLLLYSCQVSDEDQVIETGINYRNVGKYDESALNFVIYLRNYPNGRYTQMALYNLASIYNYNLNYKDLAIRYYQQLIRNYRDSELYLQSLLALADIYQNQPQPSVRKAASILETALNYDKIIYNQWILTALRLVNAYFQLNEYDLARSILKELLLKITDDASLTTVKSYAYYKIGQSYQIENYSNLAIIYFDEAKKLGKNEAGETYASLKLAEIFEEQGQSAKAASVLAESPLKEQ